MLGIALPGSPVLADQPQVVCVAHKSVVNWTNLASLQAYGFFPEIVTSDASLNFENGGSKKSLGLDVATTNIFTGQNVASRITEIDTSVPPSERVKCWQPDANHVVAAEYELRFDQTAAPQNLTENALLWNAPFGDNPIPLTAVGVTRSLDLATGQPVYSAIVAQDLVFSPDFSGLLLTAPMPAWLNPSDWHKVRVTESVSGVVVEVSQGAHPYTVVLQASLLHTPEPLGFEASVDNEVFPGVFAPVVTPDEMHVGQLDIKVAP